MLTVFEFPDKFMSASSFRAVLRSDDGDESILVEMRKRVDGRWKVFTVVASEIVRASSLQELLLTRPDCYELVIPHEIEVSLNGETKHAQLYEIYARTLQEQVMGRVSIRLRLYIEGSVFETGFNDVLQDALEEIRELIGNGNQLWLRTCHDCRHVWATVNGGGWDERDELSCYRDAPEAGAEVRKKGKFASKKAIGAGEYYVSAFHSCAAWEPSKTLDV
jgi:hypothetical protein